MYITSTHRDAHKSVEAWRHTLDSGRRHGTSVELGSSSCCIILFGMLFLFPGSKRWCIAPSYPASHTHTHNFSLILVGEPLSRKQALTDAPNKKETRGQEKTS